MPVQSTTKLYTHHKEVFHPSKPHPLSAYPLPSVQKSKKRHPTISKEEKTTHLVVMYSLTEDEEIKYQRHDVAKEKISRLFMSQAGLFSQLHLQNYTLSLFSRERFESVTSSF